MIRTILLKLEADESGRLMADSEKFKKHFPDLDPIAVAHHCYLLKEAGLIDAIPFTPYGWSGVGAWPIALTWQGHKFLGAMKDESAWSKLSDTVAKTGAWTVKAVLEIGVKAIIQHVLPSQHR